MEEEDKEKKAFSCSQKLWQFCIVPFGLYNALATFEHLTEQILEGFHWKSLLVYLDVIFLLEMERIAGVVSWISEVHLNLKPKKCYVLLKEVATLTM